VSAAEAEVATEVEPVVSAEVGAAHSVVVEVEDEYLVAVEASASVQERCCIVPDVLMASEVVDSLSCISHPLNVFCDYATSVVDAENVSGDLDHLTGRCDIAVPRETQPLLLCVASPSCSERVCG
jgi:hypothetical protein